jgi:hypothetical protein
MKKARCETCGVLVDAELTHNGVCMVGHYVHCGWGHEVAPDELVSEYDIVARLERIAIMAEISSHHTPDGTMRMMPAEGVADVIYEAMSAIVDLRADMYRAEEAILDMEFKK